MHFYYQKHDDWIEFYTDSVDFEILVRWMGHRTVHVDFFLGYDCNKVPVVKENTLGENSLGFENGGILKDLNLYLKVNNVQVYEYKLVLGECIRIATAEPSDVVVRMPPNGHMELLQELFEILELNEAILECLLNKPGIMFKIQNGALQAIGEYPDLDEWHQKHFEDKWPSDEFD